MIHIEFTYKRWRTLADPEHADPEGMECYEMSNTISFANRDAANTAARAAEADPTCVFYRVVKR